MKSNLWKEYFYIPKKERSITILLLLMVNVLISLSYLFSSKADNELVINQYATNPERRADKVDQEDAITSLEYIYVNKLKQNDWQQLGFSEKQSNMILSFKKRIGVFESRSDLLKVYCIDQGFIDKYENVLKFDATREFKAAHKQTSTSIVDTTNEKLHNQQIVSEEIRLVDLNFCTKTDLIALPGVGEVLSKRILKYRDLLGGFASSMQLMEVYGMSKENYLRCKDFVTITTPVKKIFLNKADFKTLIRHPYLNKSQVKAIINYREQHNGFKNIEELMKLYSISDSVFIKIAPYIFVE